MLKHQQKKWIKNISKITYILLDNPTRKCTRTVCTSCFTFRWKVFQTVFQFRLTWSRQTTRVLFIFAHIFRYSSFILRFFHFGSSFVAFIETYRFARIFSIRRLVRSLVVFYWRRYPTQCTKKVFNSSYQCVIHNSLFIHYLFEPLFMLASFEWSLFDAPRKKRFSLK